MKSKLFLILFGSLLSIEALKAQDVSFTKTGLSYSSDWTSVCLLDLDKDGYLDIFGSTRANNQAHTFLKNNTNGGFKEDLSLFSFGGYANSAAWADIENDGDLDLVLSVDGKLQFVYNNADNGFYYQSGSYLKSSGPVDWVDFDNNGFIDFSSGENLHKQSSMYSYDSQTPFTFTGKPSWCDYDNDGDADVLASTLLKNNGNGTFTDVTTDAFPGGYSYNGNTISWADYNNDGWSDIFVSNNNADILYTNNGDGTFSKAINALPNDYSTAYTSAWADFDNDGDLDLYTGSYMITINASLQSNNLYINNHDGTFSLADAPIFNFASYESWKTSSAAWGDVNNDGKQDLVISRIGWGLTLYKNTDSYDNSWITLNLTGKRSNKAAIGAKIYLRATIYGEEELQVREVRALNGGGQSSLATSFGLGDATIINSIEIHWPSGIINKYNDVSVDQILNLTENENVTSIQSNKESIEELQLRYNSTPGLYDLFSKSGSYELSIVDINGKTVVKKLDINEGHNTIDLSGLAHGVYLIQARNGNHYYSQTLLY